MSLLFKNTELIKENSNVQDLFNFSETISDIRSYLENIKSNTIVELVGDYGTGKSTALFQLENEKKEDEFWINFDAWKYPDKSQLWEGFILDVAAKLNSRDEVLALIAGQNKNVKAATGAAKVIGAVVPGVSLISDLLDVFEKAPATRIFQLQDILEKLLNKPNKKLRIVIEDIDRSGDAGVFFLETLNQFLDSTKVDKGIIVIVPVSTERHYENSDSYSKAVHYVYHFAPTVKSVTKFINAVFLDSLFEGEYLSAPGTGKCTGEIRKKQLESFLLFLLNYQGFNIRTLKRVLRNADQQYFQLSKKDQDPDWRIVIAAEFSYYLPIFSRESKGGYVPDKQAFWRSNSIPHSNVISPYLGAIYNNAESIYIRNRGSGAMELAYPSYRFDLITRESLSTHPSFIWFDSDNFGTGEKRFLLYDFYFQP